MNKPYFAKYLLVKGEIQEEKGGFVSRIPDSKKLFLCSRDIQVGDNPVYSNNDQEGKYPFEWPPSNSSPYEDDKPYWKRVGEISPEATWVKEGDEFEEHEWNDVFDVMVDNSPVIIEIKGPCGHFH